MKAPIAFVLAGFVGTAAFTSLRAQPFLSIDINDRSTAPAGVTMAGFSSFIIESNLSATAKQTNVTTRTFTTTLGDITVTLAGVGNDPGYDDRLRTTAQGPVNQMDFTESLLLRDFVFSPANAGGGLDIALDGLTPDQVYRVSIRSFDTGNTGSRVSDWFANGSLVRDNYVFDGSVLPTNNTQYRFDFKVVALPTGRIFIQGRRDAASSGISVFLNALEVEVSTPDPPAIVTPPQNQTVYAGERVEFTVSHSGTAPFFYQWIKDDNDLPDATNAVLVLTNVQSGNAGDYSVVVSNASGTAMSSSGTLTVLPVENIATRLVAYWQMDTLDALSPDTTTNLNHLTATNMASTNLLGGNFGGAVFFDGTNALLLREVTPGTGLPAAMHRTYSVALWVKGSFSNQLDRRVFSESANTNNNPLLNIGTHNQASNGVVDIYIRNNNGSVPVNHRRSGLIAFDDTWHHIAWVDDAGYARLYVDGTQDTNDFTYARGVLTPNLTTVGGILRGTATHYFTGLIDDVAVWGRALTSDEVLEVMASGPLPAGDIVIASINPGGGDVVVEFTSPSPMATHRIVESDSVAGPVWTPVADVVITGPVGNTFTATFPQPTGGQKFYRVARP